MLAQVEPLGNHRIGNAKSSSIGEQNAKIRAADDNLFCWHLQCTQCWERLCAIFVDFISNFAYSKRKQEELYQFHPLKKKKVPRHKRGESSEKKECERHEEKPMKLKMVVLATHIIRRMSDEERREHMFEFQWEKINLHSVKDAHDALQVNKCVH